MATIHVRVGVGAGGSVAHRQASLSHFVFMPVLAYGAGIDKPNVSTLLPFPLHVVIPFYSFCSLLFLMMAP